MPDVETGMEAGKVVRFEHPGAGRRRARSTPKGRQVDPTALREVETLLGDQLRERHHLIEHLHALQDHYHQLTAAHLAALAEMMRLSFAEVFETATFYAHFDVVREGEPDLAPLVVRVCDSVTCAMFGAKSLLFDLQQAERAGGLGRGVRVVRAPCVGMCDHAPVVATGHHTLENADIQSVKNAIISNDTQPHIPPYIEHAAYVAAGGYQVLDHIRTGALPAEQVLQILDDGALRGLGGAGFPTGRKWRSVRGMPGPRVMAVNADEGEPGTFKDRFFLLGDPHRFLEGMLIGAAIVEAEDIYIYVRDEYPAAREILHREISKLPEGVPRIHLRRGAGAYICGEESAMLESLEGKRGLPRHKPPFPFQSGLFGQPTLINNVETLYWVRDLIERGAAWWQSLGRNGASGLRSFSVSGRVKSPGVKIAPAGITAAELIDEFCGGMSEGHSFAAYLPGGASGGVLPASMADIPLDFGRLEKHGCFIGSAAVVVFSQADNIPAVALNLMEFFEDESCGQCTPCRNGTQKARMLMQRKVWDTGLLGELVDVMRSASICGLGQAAGNPLASVIRYFPETLLPETAR